ncbi:MAG: carbohydrate-binding family 6 protein [Pseudomonadota bacterium]
MRMNIWLAMGALALCACEGASAFASGARISADPTSARETFAADDIEAALRARRLSVARDDSRRPDSFPFRARAFVFFESASRYDAGIGLRSAAGANIDSAAIGAEGFALRHSIRDGRHIFSIVSRDAGGAMYGGLELAEQIRTRGIEDVVDTDRNPYMSLRGTKFNLPLDLRTPSYSDMSDSAQQNIATVWDFDFWRAYLDALARDRYNMLSLWNLHPFPSMVKVPEFPDVALNDVWRSKIQFDEDYSTRTIGLVTPAMLANKEALKKLTIDEKIDFWRRVMAYAHDRNIAVHVVTWNVYTYGVDGKYGITDAIDNPATRDYFRASVREMFRTYPLLAGMGLTVGENMGEASFQAKEDWALATYGQGVLDAARAEPQRQFRLIHRQHEAGAADIAATFAPVIAQPNVEFVFSFKYAQAHVLSSTKQTFHGDFVASLGNLKTLWTLRNDDALMFRWAAPDFVREFVRNIPYEKSCGFYYGSDMWVWGREFLSKTPATPRQLEIDKHWLPFLLWGRLGYDPSLDDERIAALVAQRFPRVDAAKLLAAWQDASMVYPLVTGFHWGALDFQWYIEGSRSRPAPAKTASGFHNVETFINQPVHPGTDNITIPDFVAGTAKGELPPGTTPPQVAQKIDARADAALAGIAQLLRGPLARKNPELSATLEDIRAMALLGKYYAAKIRGATALALYRKTKLAVHQSEAVKQLSFAAGFWTDYTARTGARYRNPLWTNRVGLVDWRELDAEVAHDIAIARAPLP